MKLTLLLASFLFLSIAKFYNEPIERIGVKGPSALSNQCNLINPLFRH